MKTKTDWANVAIFWTSLMMLGVFSYIVGSFVSYLSQLLY